MSRSNAGTLIEISAPGVEPITTDEVKAAARIDDTAFDAQLALVIPAVRRAAEARLQRRLITQTVELRLDAFPAAEIDLLLPNVQSIVSVKYYDTAGVLQTYASANYTLDASSTPGWLLPAPGTYWPATQEIANAVRIQFVVGYGDAATDVPAEIKLWLIAHAVQILRTPDGLAGELKPLPFVDHQLDQHINWGRR